ncbi:MAG: hypothetical protein H6557_09665 [Lewinellaceae bacterium]|nr:hypothetical protein [Phaeodactylibacter sp.]MCB9036873.1 hypothetical protein [Lewinellaceae bacterium]
MKCIRFFSFVFLSVLAVSCSQGEGGQTFREFFSKQKEGQSEEATQATPAVDTAGQGLHRQNTALQEENTRLQSEGLQLRRELQQERMARLAARQDSLNTQLLQIQAALEAISEDSVSTTQTRDSLLQKQRFTQQMDQEIQERLVAKSKAVDVQLGKLEEQKRSLQQQMDLEKRQVEIAEKKIAVLREEQELYESQRQKLWVDGAPQSTIDEAAAAIANADKNIEAEQKKINSASANINGLQETVAEIDIQLEALNASIRKSYTAKEILEETIAEEQEQLASEIAGLDSAWQSRQAERPALLRDKEETEALLVGLEQKTAEILKAPAPRPDSPVADTVQASSVKEQEQSAEALAVATPDSLSLQKEQAHPREAEKNRQFYLRFLALFGALLVLLFGFYVLRRRRKRAKS